MEYTLVERKEGGYKRAKYRTVRELGACASIEDARESAVIALYQLRQSGDPQSANQATRELSLYRKDPNIYLSDVTPYYLSEVLPPPKYYLLDSTQTIHDLWVPGA